jgi:hypothetical protein
MKKHAKTLCPELRCFQRPSDSKARNILYDGLFMGDFEDGMPPLIDHSR